MWRQNNIDVNDIKRRQHNIDVNDTRRHQHDIDVSTYGTRIHIPSFVRLTVGVFFLMRLCISKFFKSIIGSDSTLYSKHVLGLHVESVDHCCVSCLRIQKVHNKDSLLTPLPSTSSCAKTSETPSHCFKKEQSFNNTHCCLNHLDRCRLHCRRLGLGHQGAFHALRASKGNLEWKFMSGWFVIKLQQIMKQIYWRRNFIAFSILNFLSVSLFRPAVSLPETIWTVNLE